MKRGVLASLKIIFLTILLLCCYIIISSKLTGTTSQIGGFQFISVLTGSMYPEINPGSLILVKKVNAPELLRVNDVITFQSPRNENQLITHRIVEVKNVDSNIFFTTKGDANLTPDIDEVADTNVFGKYQNIVIPYGGYILQLTKTKIGFLLFFLIPVFVLIISSFTNIWAPFIQRDS
ncbi:signal peptidase I [Schinkia sp. CFF1]